MTDSRDKPELETLNYRNKECLAKSSSTPMGFNSVIIKPETRTNKIEDAHEPVGCPDLEAMHSNKTAEQPNKNLMIIEEIEGLISQVNEKLERLEAYYGKSKVKNQALEEIDLFQKTTLFELRKAFE